MSWSTKLRTLINLTDACRAMCVINSEDYKLYANRRASGISNPALKNVVMQYSGIFGELLERIQHDVDWCTDPSNIPASCMLSTIDLSMYKSGWSKHVFDSAQSLIELSEKLEYLNSKIREKLAAFYKEDTGGYSSYSDYSEETDSDEEEGDDDDDEDEDDEDEDEDEDEEENKRKKSPPKKKKR